MRSRADHGGRRHGGVRIETGVADMMQHALHQDKHTHHLPEALRVSRYPREWGRESEWERDRESERVRGCEGERVRE